MKSKVFLPEEYIIHPMVSPGVSVYSRSGGETNTENRKDGGRIIEILNFVIAIVALVIAVMAFQRTGGTKDLGKGTAELLAKMEKKMREKEAAKVEKGKTQQ